MPEEEIFLFKKKINAPASLIYNAFTSATALREWLCDVSTTYPDEGGRVYLAWYDGYFASGHFIELVPNKKIKFSWIGKDEPDWTQVKVAISPLDDEDGFLVTLNHSGIGTSGAWAKAREEITQGGRSRPTGDGQAFDRHLSRGCSFSYRENKRKIRDPCGFWGFGDRCCA
jgi:uncharacterized protein YndB with AHSA1/START domain